MNTAGHSITAGADVFLRGCVLTIGITAIRYSAIGDLVTYQKDTRFAENGDINAPGAARRSLSGTHFAQKWPTCAAGKWERSLRPPGVPPGGWRV